MDWLDIVIAVLVNVVAGVLTAVIVGALERRRRARVVHVDVRDDQDLRDRQE
jgi:ABC-type uncharacterized transport system permease subunit